MVEHNSKKLLQQLSPNFSSLTQTSTTTTQFDVYLPSSPSTNLNVDQGNLEEGAFQEFGSNSAQFEDIKQENCKDSAQEKEIEENVFLKPNSPHPFN